MGVCNFTLKINGQDVLFRSQEDLNKFLYNNRDIINASEKQMNFSKGIEGNFSDEYNTMESAFARLLTISKKGPRRNMQPRPDMDMLRRGEKNEGGAIDVITGTNVHALPWNREGRPFVTPKNEQDYIKSKIEEIRKTNRFKPVADIEKELKAEIATWDKMAEYGTDLHKIPEMVFSADSVDATTVFEEIKKSNPSTKITMENVLDTLDGLNGVKSYLDSVHGPNPKYMTEVHLETKRADGKTVKGIIDLIVIDSKGVPHIYDFKTSSKNIRYFSQIKEQSYRYQLGLYRQLLGDAGFNVKSSTLGIIPIQMNDVNYDKDTIGQVIINANDVKNLTEEEHMMFGQGYIWRNLHKVLPTKLGSFAVGSDFVSESGDLVEAAFGYQQNLSTTIQNVKKYIKNLPKEDGKYKFWNKLERDFVYIPESNIEEYITNYLQELNEVNLTAASELGQNLAPYLDGLVSNVRSSKSVKAGFDTAQYAEYYKSGWSINRDFEHLGILILTHDESQVMDVINVTVNSLDSDFEMVYGKTILGNFMNDQAVNDDKLLSSNTANIELLRSMLIINELSEKNLIPNGYKIGQFKVVDHKGSTAFNQNQVYLYHSFNRLINLINKKTGKNIKNNFDDKLQIEKFEDRIVRIFQGIIDNEDAFSHAQSVLDTFKTGNSERISARLVQLLHDLREYGANATTKTFNNGISRLSVIVAEAINHYYNSDQAFNIDGRIYANGFNFEYSVKDVAKWSAPSRGTMTSLPTVAADKFTTDFENRIMIPARQKIINETNKLGEYTRTSFEDLRKESLHIGPQANLYDNCFEEGTAGDKFHPSLRVKNPYDSKTNLTKAERKFLIAFLEKLNLYRYGEIEDSEKEDHIRSGEWFEVPLMRSELANKLTAGGTIKEYVGEKIDEITNVNEQLDPEMLRKERKQHEEFEEYITNFDISHDKRSELLATNGVKAYSRDLSTILISFGMKSIQKSVMSKVLPMARASIIFNNGFFDLNNVQGKEFQDYLLKYMLTNVYGKMHIPDNLKKQAAFIQGLSAAMATSALACNALSISRELIQGVYNNFLRVATRHMAIDPPSIKDLTFSYSQVTGKMLKDVKHNNKLNGLAMQFHGIMGGSLSTLVGDVGVNSNSIGGKLFKGDIMFKANQFPDFMHRLSLLIAFMKKDGCYDSYKWKGEVLEYDWKSDKRFDVFVKYKENPPLDAKLREEYEKQRGLYAYMIQLFADSGEVNASGQKLEYGDDLPMAYTANLIATIKDIIDQTHGHMSGYTKTQMERTLYGSMYMMFKSYVKSKVNTYTMKSGRYVQGEVVPQVDKDTGKQLYRHILKDASGKVIEDYVDDNPEGGIMQYEYIKSYQEGIWDSLLKSWNLYKEHGLLEGFNEAISDDVIKRNLKYLGSDLFICLCLFAMFKMAFDWEEIEEEYGYTLTKILQSPFLAPMDNNPLLFMNTILGTTEPPVIAMTGQWMSSLLQLGASPNLENLNNVAENIAMYRIANDLKNQFSE